MEDNLLLLGDLADFLNGLDGADFVVAVHDGHQDGIIPDGISHITGID